jgi:hypothetical protein
MHRQHTDLRTLRVCRRCDRLLDVLAAVAIGAGLAATLFFGLSA